MSSNTGNTILALLTGAAIGAGIGILFAPDKGSRTRKKIKDKLDESKEDAIEKYNEIVDLMKTKTANVKADMEETIESWVSTGSYKAEEVIELLEKKLDALKKQNAKLKK